MVLFCSLYLIYRDIHQRLLLLVGLFAMAKMLWMGLFGTGGFCGSLFNKFGLPWEISPLLLALFAMAKMLWKGLFGSTGFPELFQTKRFLRFYLMAYTLCCSGSIPPRLDR